MRSWRREDGQAAVSYGGLLAVLGLLFGALFTLGLDQRIARTVEGAVCVITGGTECVEPDGTTTGLGEHEDSGRAEREVYDAGCDNDLPGDLRREGDDDATGDPEADAAWENLGRTYDYYRDTFGRDSYDDSGAELIATVNFCETPGRQFDNAYWNGDQMVFGEGYANPLDITAHELTHAITDRTADLVYECQSGALNESFSDIFASNVDTDDWEIGEDLPDGAIRDMSDPGRFGDPAHVDDYDTRPNDGDPFNDHGAVHSNSGIPNHAYHLMVQRIGRERAEQVMYRVVTEELKPTSGFEDFRTASLEAARELYGVDSAAYAGIDASFADVGLDGTWEAPEIEGVLSDVVLKTMRIGPVVMAMALLVLAGCGGDEAEAPGGGGEDAAARLEGALTYTRGGGIAGRADKLVVQPDGSATLTTRQGGERRFRLDDAELAGLASELRRAKLAELPERSVSDPAVPDAFGHRIAYRGITVTTDDPAMPEQLSALVGRLGGLVEAHERG